MTTKATTETDARLVPQQQQPQKQQHHVVALIMIGQAADDDFKYNYDHHVAASAQNFEPLHSAMAYFHQLHQQHQRRRITKRRTCQDSLSNM